jgi:hypothetical protein
MIHHLVFEFIQKFIHIYTSDTPHKSGFSAFLQR